MNVRSSFLGVLAGGLAVACDSDPVGVSEYQGHTGVRSSTRESASIIAAAGPVLSGSGTPTIDGQIAPGEWAGAAVADFNLSTWGDSHPAKFYVMNDDAYLYMAVVIENDDFAPVGDFQGDYLNIYFDNDHDGGIAYSNAEPNDDWVQIPAYLGESLLDGFNCQAPCELPHNFQPDIYDGGTTDLFAVRTHSNPVEGSLGTYVFEIRKPLASADAGHDFTLHEGDVVGVFLDFVDTPAGEFAGAVSTWPGPDSCTAFAFGGPACQESEILISSSALTVTIDIKPGTFPNNINPRSNGNTPVAILTTALFDARTIDPASIRLDVAGTTSSPAKTSFADVDGDGDIDIVAHFNTQSAGFRCGVSSANLTAQTATGRKIKGFDSITVVGCES